MQDARRAANVSLLGAARVWLGEAPLRVVADKRRNHIELREDAVLAVRRVLDDDIDDPGVRIDGEPVGGR